MRRTHAELIADAAGALIAVADSGRDLCEVIAEMERYVVTSTKVGDGKRGKIPADRRAYTLNDEGRLVSIKKGRKTS